MTFAAKRSRPRSRGGGRRLARVALAVAAAASCAAALGAGTDAQREKAAPCTACHGDEGRSALADIPSLAAQPKQFITTQLVMFREGNRKNPVMNTLAAPLTNAEISELGSYFAAQSAAPAGRPLAADAAGAGRGLVEKLGCVTCHGAELRASSTSRASPASDPSTCARNCSASRPGRASTWTAT
jgi:cytochrome c553